MSQFFLGLDLGQTQDWTALAIIERVMPPGTAGTSVRVPEHRDHRFRSIVITHSGAS